MAVKTQKRSTQKPAATNSRNFRTFLLMQQFAAKEIGARIRQARLERGMTQEQLAEISSFSKRSLQNYETGVTIPYRHLRELARLLRRREEWFLYGNEANPLPPEVERFEALADRLEKMLLRLEEERTLQAERRRSRADRDKS